MLMICLDTPWDEPTMNSTEFVRYVNGEIFDDPLWCHIRGDALCKRFAANQM